MRNLRSLRRTCPRRRLPPERAVHIDFSDIHSVKEDDRQCSDNMRNTRSEANKLNILKGDAGIDSRVQRPAHSGFAVSKEKKHHQGSNPDKQKYRFLQQRGRRTSDPRHRPRRRSLHLWRHQPSGMIWKRQNGRYAYVW